MNKVNAYTYYYEGEYGECTVFLNSDKIPVDIVFGNDGIGEQNISILL